MTVARTPISPDNPVDWARVTGRYRLPELRELLAHLETHWDADDPAALPGDLAHVQQTLACLARAVESYRAAINAESFDGGAA